MCSGHWSWPESEGAGAEHRRTRQQDPEDGVQNGIRQSPAGSTLKQSPGHPCGDRRNATRGGHHAQKRGETTLLACSATIDFDRDPMTEP